MNDNNIRQWLWDFFIFTLLTIAMMLMLSSCKTKYVTVPEYHTQYVVKGDTLWMRDSILIHDSASVEIVGDTVRTFKFLYKDRYKYIYRNKVDTTIVRARMPYASPKISFFLLPLNQASLAAVTWSMTQLAALTVL